MAIQRDRAWRRRNKIAKDLNQKKFQQKVVTPKVEYKRVRLDKNMRATDEDDENEDRLYWGGE